MKLHFKLAWRNIWRNKRRTLITVSAIVFAVFAAIFLQSVNRGSYEVMIERMVSFNTGFVQIQDYRYKDESSLDNSFYFDEDFHQQILSVDSRITAAVPRIQTFMLAANDVATRGAVIFGIEPELEKNFNDIENYVISGEMITSDDNRVLISNGLANRLQLGVADTLALIGQGRFGMSASGLFEIAGILEHPLRDLDNQSIFMPLREAQYLFSADGYVTGVMIGLDRERSTNSVAQQLKENLGDDELVVYTWPELMPEILELMEMDLATPRLLSLVLYVVIGFGFFGTVLTMTMERLREFGVLMSIGMQRISLAGVVLIETIIISILGALFGMGFAWLILKLIDPIHLYGDAEAVVVEMGFDPVIPMSFAADQFYTQAFFVFLIALVVFTFPLLKILKLNILKAARM